MRWRRNWARSGWRSIWTLSYLHNLHQTGAYFVSRARKALRFVTLCFPTDRSLPAGTRQLHRVGERRALGSICATRKRSFADNRPVLFIPSNCVINLMPVSCESTGSPARGRHPQFKIFNVHNPGNPRRRSGRIGFEAANPGYMPRGDHPSNVFQASRAATLA